jgi:hypothetical protein
MSVSPKPTTQDWLTISAAILNQMHPEHSFVADLSAISDGPKGGKLEYLIVNSIPFADSANSLITQGILDRFDAFLVADALTYKQLSERYGQSWVIHLPLPAVFYSANDIRTALTTLLVEHPSAGWDDILARFNNFATDRAIKDKIQMQWTIYNKQRFSLIREHNDPDNYQDIVEFLSEIDLTTDTFATKTLVVLRSLFAARYPDLDAVLDSLATPRLSGPAYVVNDDSRVSAIIQFMRFNYGNLPTKDSIAIASFIITHRSNNTYQYKCWDSWNDIPKWFESHRLRARPWVGALNKVSIEADYQADVVQVAAKVQAILTSWDAIYAASHVDNLIKAQHLAFLATGNPDAQYVSALLDNLSSTVGTVQDRRQDLVKLIGTVLFESEISAGKVIVRGWDPELRCFNMNYLSQNIYKGYHRSGWQYVVENMLEFDINDPTNKHSVLFDSYLDRTFHWNLDVMKQIKDIDGQPLVPYHRAWTGFIHHTPNTTYSNYNVTAMLQKPEFRQSLPYCLGLYVMSEYLAGFVRSQLAIILSELRSQGVDVPSKIPVSVLTHPTESPFDTFSFERFAADSSHRLLQVGGWLRDSFSIYGMNIDEGSMDLHRAALKGKNMDMYFKPFWFDRELRDGYLAVRPGPSACNWSNYSAPLTDLINPTSLTGSICRECECESKISRDCDVSAMSREWIIKEATMENLEEDAGIGSARIDAVASRNRFLTGLLQWLQTRMLTIDFANMLDSLQSDGHFALDNLDIHIHTDLLNILNRVEIVEKVSNVEYDSLLSASVVTLKLIDASAVNTLIECIVRNTPVLVNSHPAVVELLGKDYPLYLNNFGNDLSAERIRAATEYLKTLPKRQFWIESFIENLFMSEVGRNCWFYNKLASLDSESTDNWAKWQTFQAELKTREATVADRVDFPTYVTNMTFIYDSVVALTTPIQLPLWAETAAIVINYIYTIISQIMTTIGSIVADHPIATSATALVLIAYYRKLKLALRIWSRAKLLLLGS